MDGHEERRSRGRGPWSLLAGAVLVVVLVIAVGVVVGRGLDGRSEIAGPVDPPLSVDVPTVPPVAPRLDITSYASPEAPTAVGVRTMTFTDRTRGTSARGDRPELETRPLQVTIRYPTEGMPAADEIVDAPSLAPAPLVLFAHGFDISAEDYAPLLHDLASFGFVVAAPDFPMTSTVFDGTPDEYDLPQQSRDLSFLITALTGPAAPPEVVRLVDPGPVGLLGHSDGAITVLLTAFAPRYADTRVGAVIAISGDFDSFGGEWFSTTDPPLVAVHGEWDELNPFSSSEELVAADPGPAMLVRVLGASHLAAANGPDNAPAIARLAAFDLRWRLRGSDQARVATFEQASTPPLELVADHD